MFLMGGASERPPSSISNSISNSIRIADLNFKSFITFLIGSKAFLFYQSAKLLTSRPLELSKNFPPLESIVELLSSLVVMQKYY